MKVKFEDNCGSWRFIDVETGTCNGGHGMGNTPYATLKVSDKEFFSWRDSLDVELEEISPRQYIRQLKEEIEILKNKPQ